jgi:hypothetical protein
MKTRTLLLLALGCGLAIMVAGAVFLFQLTTQDDVAEPVPTGQAVGIGDMTVAVLGAEESGGQLRVTVEIGGVRDDEPAADFRLIASGRPALVSGTTCPPTGVDIQSCTVTFDVSTADGVSRVLFYERGDDRARWVLG